MGEKKPARWVDYWPLANVKGAKKNPKAHDLGAIVESIEANDFGEAPLLDERTQRLVAGHGRIAALAALKKDGKPAPAGVEVREGEWFVPILRGWKSENDAQADAYLLGSNRTAELGGWDTAALADMLGGLASIDDGLLGSGFDGDDVDEAVAEQAAAGTTDSEEDALPEEPRKLWVKSGELWRVGEHRILCGDSTVEEDVDRLLSKEPGAVSAVIADPPYAIYGSSTGIGADIADDKMVRPFFESIFRTCFRVLPYFAHVYLCTDWRSWAAMYDSAKRERFSCKNCLVWDKGGSGLGSSWAMSYELIGFFAKLHPAKAMKSGTVTGQRTVHKPNLLRFNRVTGDEREHNAAKPVGLLKELVEAATDVNQAIFDPFGGSGSVLVAGNALGRRVFTMEIEPKWVQVTLERFERLTGQKPERLEGA